MMQPGASLYAQQAEGVGVERSRLEVSGSFKNFQCTYHFRLLMGMEIISKHQLKEAVLNIFPRTAAHFTKCWRLEFHQFAVIPTVFKVDRTSLMVK
ncbi:unnamed protein product [Caretta caretta]